METSKMKIKEILVLHHSHLDVGYTHSQPVLWELQREYLDLALGLLEETADWPEHSRPKWTCEVTAPVLKWLESASPTDLDRFRAFVGQGRLAIGAMRYNITPLNTAAQLRHQLAPVFELRKRLGTPITAALQHDINGVPWPLADLLLDHGVGLFIMAINRHLGNAVQPRPGIFRWQTPSGRELRVLNGNHYTMFDQILLTWDRSLEAMERGFTEYLPHLEKIGYPHDFLYLTTTACPQAWDNSPPNPAVAKLIRSWNEAGREPRIRYVTPEELRTRIDRIPAESLPLLSGDWTDYWCFGCGSTAADVARSRLAKRRLATAERLAAGQTRPVAVERVRERASDLLDLYDEHTWSYYATVTPLDPAYVQDRLKTAMVVEANELAVYALTNELETLARNPAFTEKPQTEVLFVNPAPVARCEFVEIPAHWRKPGPRLRCQRFSPAEPKERETVGPVELPPYGIKRVALSELVPISEDDRIRHEDRRISTTFRALNHPDFDQTTQGDALLESPWHQLAFDPVTGRILGLRDKILDWQVLPEGAPYDFFDFVRERPDALWDARREAYYERILDKEKVDQTCWKKWRAVRERATRPLECQVKRQPGSISLERTYAAPGTSSLRQCIRLRADSPVIELEVEMEKLAYPDPEAIYFVMPVALAEGWRAHFDTAGRAVELDREQLPGACRGWLTAESYLSLHGPERGATLFCPDAPMVVAGDFHFGPPPEPVPRQASPLLLGWALNNYWNTNFPVTQPGKIRLRYGFRSHGAFDAATAACEAAAFANPILAHPAFG